MINTVCLVGNLAADPEIRRTQTGKKVAKMRLAVNEYWINRQTGNRNERTHWFTLNAWDRMADTCERYLRKGIKIAVRGSLEYQEWTAPDGGKRSKIEIRMREMEILTPKGSVSISSEDRKVAASGSDYGMNTPDDINNYGSYTQEKAVSDDFPEMQDDGIPF